MYLYGPLDEVEGLSGKVEADKNGLGQIMPNTKSNAPVGQPQAATGVNFGSYMVFRVKSTFQGPRLEFGSKMGSTCGR